MRINEIFNQQYPYKWLTQDESSWLGHFATKHNEIFVEFKNIFDMEYDLSFTTGGGSANLTGDGDPFKIFVTLIAMMRDFSNQVNPDTITFTASKEDSGNGMSRIKLYRKMLKSLANEFNVTEYDQLSHPRSPKIKFKLVRK